MDMGILGDIIDDKDKRIQELENRVHILECENYDYAKALKYYNEIKEENKKMRSVISKYTINAKHEQGL